MTLTTFASRQPATYIKGEVFDGHVSTDQMLAKANLAGWNVRLREIETDARSKKKAFECIRTNPFDGGLDRLGIAGERYGEVQNETVFHMFDDLDPKWSAAGQFRDGALVYGEAETDRTIIIDEGGVNDVLRPRVVVATTHDSSGALKIGRTLLRLDCLNMWQAIFGDLQHSITIRHTLSIGERIKKIRQTWKTNNAYFDEVAVAANVMFQKKVTDDQFFGIVGHLMGERPELNTKGAQTKYDNALEDYSAAWKGDTNARIRGTQWGAFQALVERNQWARTIQNTPRGQENFAMAGMGLDGATVRFRQNALDLVRSL